MGFLPTQKNIKILWVNVAKGVMKVKVPDAGAEGGKRLEEHGGFRGYITGMRSMQKVYQGNDMDILQIRVDDPNNSEYTIILCGTWRLNGYVTTYGKMLISRLWNPDNNISPDDKIDLSVYPATSNDGTDNNGTCVGIRIRGKRIPGAPNPHFTDYEDPNRRKQENLLAWKEACTILAEDRLVDLINKYGEFDPYAPADISIDAREDARQDMAFDEAFEEPVEEEYFTEDRPPTEEELQAYEERKEKTSEPAPASDDGPFPRTRREASTEERSASRRDDVRSRVPESVRRLHEDPPPPGDEDALPSPRRNHHV